MQFANRVASTTPGETTQADGIIALTGGESRIADAIMLLEQSRGKRLLISGVHPATTEVEIARTVPGSQAFFSCCIDLDYGALNTLGNARAARDWANSHGYSKLLIVTSAYHMPRSLMELNRIAPDIELVPHPVRTERLELERWWADFGVMKVMASEYAKYLMARINLRFGRSNTTKEAAMAGYSG